MIEEQGRVVTADDNSVWVETIRQSSCSACDARHGCGQHLSEKYRTSNAFAYIRASSPWPLHEGDRVVVGIPENSLMKATMLVYLLPLLMMMAFLWLSGLLGLSDGPALLVTACGLVAGFIPARRLGRKQSDICRIKVVQVLSRQGSAVESLSIRNA